MRSARPNTVSHNSQCVAMARATYPITFDLNPCILETSYPSPSWQNAYADIGRFLRENGFSRQQGSVYFGDETIDVIAAR